MFHSETLAIGRLRSVRLPAAASPDCRTRRSNSGRPREALRSLLCRRSSTSGQRLLSSLHLLFSTPPRRIDHHSVVCSDDLQYHSLDRAFPFLRIAQERQPDFAGKSQEDWWIAWGVGAHEMFQKSRQPSGTGRKPVRVAYARAGWREGFSYLLHVTAWLHLLRSQCYSAGRRARSETKTRRVARRMQGTQSC